MSSLNPQRVIARLQERLRNNIPGARWDLIKTPEASWLNIRDRSQVVMARPVPDGVEITMRDTEERRDQTLRFVVRNHDDLDRGLAEGGARAEGWSDRWTLYRLRPHRQYAVVRACIDYAVRRSVPGVRLTFLKQDFSGQDERAT